MLCIRASRPILWSKGGTSVEVAHEMGIEAHGSDLHSGFNILKRPILEAVGKPSDLGPSHPPFHKIVVHCGEVWARAGETMNPS
jgi:hypothetical protein